MMKIAFDADLRRPGCVLLQAALGGTPELASHFPTESWLVAPTPGLRLYEVTEDQLEILVQMSSKLPQEETKDE